MTTATDSILVSVALNHGSQPPAIQIPVTEDLPSGSLIRIAPIKHMLNDLIAESLALPDGTVCDEVLRFSMEEQRKEWGDHPRKAGMLTVRLPQAVKKGETLTFTSRFGEIDYIAGGQPIRYSNEPKRPCFAGMAWLFHLELTEGVEADSPRRQISPQIKLHFETGSPESRQAIWKADGTLHVRQFDYCQNSVQQTGKLEVQGPTSNFQHTLEFKGEVTHLPIEASTEQAAGSRYRVTDGDGNTVMSNARPTTAAGQQICFGEFHWHCELSSDGKRPLRDALRTAREELCLDYAGPSDHIWMGGIFGENKTPEMQAEALREFDAPGRFAVLPGAELSQRVGHANFYCDSIDHYLEMCQNLPQVKPVPPAEQTVQYAWEYLTNSLIPGHTVLIPHHSNTNSFDREGVVNAENGRPYWNAMTFPRGEEMAEMRLFEIYQTRGSFEAEELDEEWRIEAGGYGASARSALMKGYRIGFTGGTDNHNGWPSRNNHSGQIDGFTAVLADGIDTASIWRALYERRCYATTGARIICDVTLNGQPIGSELKLRWNQARKMSLKIYGTAPLDKVEIVSTGGVLDSLTIPNDSWDLETEWEDTRPGRPLQDVYYYVRIRQQDGNLAWLSPFWIDAETSPE